MPLLADILPATVFTFLVIFARVGAMLMAMPGFGETFVSQRIRLVMALAIAAVIMPVVGAGVPDMPAQPVQLLPLIAGETLIGIFIGGLLRLLVTALHVAGVVISFQSSLGFAQFFDPAQGTQGALVGSFLTIMGLTLIFVTDLHHVLLRAVVDSYTLFPIARLPAAADFARTATEWVGASFLIGTQISAPFIAYALVLYIGMGLVNRLMPQMQVFFIVMPLQILLALVFLTVTLGALAVWFLDHFEERAAMFLVG
ncbi:MAG: flagellar biosynthetic protein FliR [Pseudomonadota bacterium]|nr:flagellar biosynthetic protein FliR [Pseudomonadota bacterium]